MTAVVPPPPIVRTARGALLLLATVALLSGAGTSVVIAGLAALDPLLAGDLSLPLGVLGSGLALTLVGTVVPVVAGLSLAEGRPLGRALVVVVGAGLCLTPLLLVGVWLVWVGAFDPETQVWFERVRMSPPAGPPIPPGAPGASAASISPPEPEAAT